MKENLINLNFDESVINLTTSKTYSWSRRKINANKCIAKKVSGLSIMVAVSSIGDIYFQYLDGNNNQTSVAAFFIMLAGELSKMRVDWQKNHVLLLDNCSSHKTPLVKTILKK
jgi:hypothetical protein